MVQSIEKARKVEIIADDLVEKLNAKIESRPFMCKVAWRLPEHRIYMILEQAQSPEVKNPIGLFIYLCKRDGV